MDRHRRGVRRLGAEWDDLFQRANPENIFLSFGWMSTWWKHFGKGQLAVIAVRDSAGRLVAVAPFYIARSSRRAWARAVWVSWRTSSVGSDYLNVLADRDSQRRRWRRSRGYCLRIAVFGTTSNCATPRIRR
jgi:CelD/BcsL family acetyltransferase involved in cellulose biosynthesis